MIKVLFFAKFAFLEDAAHGFDKLVTHVDHALAFDQLLGFCLDYAQRASNANYFLAPLQECCSLLAFLDARVQRAGKPRGRVKLRRLLHFLQFLRQLLYRLLYIALMHVLLEVVFKFLALRREDFLALGCLDRHLGGQFTDITASDGLPFDVTAHVLLDHERVHIDVGFHASAIAWISKTIILEVFSGFEALFLLRQHLVVTFNFTPFQIELVFDEVDSLFVLHEEHIKLSHVHLTDRTVVVSHISVD